MLAPENESPLLQRLHAAMDRRGWRGRMFGARQWLADGDFPPPAGPAPALSVILIRRGAAPTAPCEAVALLRREGIPFQCILVDVPTHGGAGAAPRMEKDSDAHLVLTAGAPWYTPFNLGAMCARGEALLFLNGAALPQPGFLAAYTELFGAHPELAAARGNLDVPGLDGCACQTTGSFILEEKTVFWPVDLDENMAMSAEAFFALGGFDESLIGGYGALDLSIRLFGRRPEFRSQRHLPRAVLRLPGPHGLGLPLDEYLLQRQRSWLQLNDACKRYLELYGKFWQEKTRGMQGE